jgi:phosphatidylglycerophosphate synthase
MKIRRALIVDALGNRLEKLKGTEALVLGGLTLLERALLVIARCGIEEIWVFCDDASEEKAKERLERRGFDRPVRWSSLSRFLSPDGDTHRAFLDYVREPFLLFPTSILIPPDALSDLIEGWPPGGEARIPGEAKSVAGAVGPPSGAGMAPWTEISSGNRSEGSGPGGPGAELIAFRLAGERPGGKKPGGEKPEKRERDSSPPAIASVLASSVLRGGLGLRGMRTACSVPRVKGPSRKDVGRAEQALLKRLHRPEIDGAVDRYFNRYLSRPITRLAAKTPVTPNQVTLATMGLGLLASALIAHGNYWLALAGAVMLQLYAVLDCVDGELARLKFMESPMGSVLDYYLDNVVHLALFAGIILHARGHMDSDRLIFCAASALLGVILCFAVFSFFQSRAKKLEGGKALMKQGAARFANHDFTVLFLILAALGRLHWFLILTAVGSHVFWIALLLVNVRKVVRIRCRKEKSEMTGES